MTPSEGTYFGRPLGTRKGVDPCAETSAAQFAEVEDVLAIRQFVLHAEADSIILQTHIHENTGRMGR